MKNRARIWVSAAVVLGLAALPVSGQDLLRFQHVAGDRYRIISQVDENVFHNGRFSHRAEILNRVVVEVTEVRDGAGLIAGTYQTVERGASDASAYGPLAEEYYSTFWRDPRGAFEIAAEERMPGVRNVPLLPEGPVQPGDTWTAQGEEVHDFRQNFGVQEPFRFPIQVHYTYHGRQTVEGRELGLIAIEYTVFHRVPMALGLATNPPEKMTGISEQLLYWDFDLGLPVAYEDDFSFIIHLVSGDVFEFTGHSSGELVPSRPLDRQRAVQEITQALQDQGVLEATVTATEEGVSIIIENVQFPPDSAVLIPAEQEKLGMIGVILRRFPERDILITGHTARVGSEATSQTLSERRAEAVGAYLLAINAKAPEQLVFRGFGSRQPVADNATEEGRRRNRRVEITILEN